MTNMCNFANDALRSERVAEVRLKRISLPWPARNEHLTRKCIVYDEWNNTIGPKPFRIGNSCTSFSAGIHFGHEQNVHQNNK